VFKVIKGSRVCVAAACFICTAGLERLQILQGLAALPSMPAGKQAAGKAQQKRQQCSQVMYDGNHAAAADASVPLQFTALVLAAMLPARTGQTRVFLVAGLEQIPFAATDLT
jgi:hypothetical protein